MDGARKLDDMLLAIRSFQESRVFLTALELDLFTAVGAGAGADEIAYRIGADVRATEMLLNALTALGALEKREGRFQCTSESMALGPARAGLMHTVHLWETWSTLTDCVKAGTTMRHPGVEGHQEAWTEAFIAAMHARAQRSAAQVVDAVQAVNPQRMLDVGGGPGTFSIAFAQAHPELRVEVLDLGPVVPMARRNIREAGLSDRVTVREGDLRTDALGEAYDLILVSAICHMLDEGENRDLLRRCARALASGGQLVIRDFILDPDRAGPPAAALFALNMLVGTRRGNAYAESDYRAWLLEAGFGDIRRPQGSEELLLARRS
ncbi:MAG TPA: methyltransferase [Geothrix sp.]|nr:methyltransferase [Geothrix sp.]